MNSKNSAASVALFLSFNLLFFSIVTATCNCNNPSNPKPTPKPKPTPSTPTTPTPKPKPTPSTPTTPTPKPKPTPSTPITPTPKPKPTPSTPTTPSSPCTPPSTPSTPSTPTPTPTPSTPSTPTTPTTPAPSSGGKCPRDALKLGVCANLLQLVNVVLGSPSTLPCCTLIQGITDLEAAICLCTAIKANVLGINLNVPVSLTLLLNTCGKKLPSGFQCA